MFCSNCGAKNKEDAVFCIECGKKLKPEETKPKNEKKINSRNTALWVRVAWVVIAFGIIFAMIVSYSSEAGLSNFFNFEHNTVTENTSKETKKELIGNFELLTDQTITADMLTVNGVGIGDSTSQIPKSIITGQEWNGIKAGFVTYHDREVGPYDNKKQIVDSISMFDKSLQDLFSEEKLILRELGPAERVSENVATNGDPYKSYDYDSRGISVVVYESDSGSLVRVFLREPR